MHFSFLTGFLQSCQRQHEKCMHPHKSRVATLHDGQGYELLMLESMNSSRSVVLNK